MHSNYFCNYEYHTLQSSQVIIVLDKSICIFFLATNEKNRELLLFFSSIKFPRFLCSILFHHTTVSLYHWSKFGLNKTTSKPQPPYLKEFTRFSSVLPWQINSTRIIKFSYHKMPCNAGFCVGLSTFPSIVFFLFITTLFAKYFKLVQFKAVCSSQIVVS